MKLVTEIKSRYDLREHLWGQGKVNFDKLCLEFPIINGQDNLRDYLEMTIDECEDVEMNDFLWFEIDTIENDRKEQN